MAAGADEFVQRLGRRYEETVGHRGIKLSGGQRQRIAIARAFLKDPAILLLDEATNSLDPDSEEIVRKALSQLLRGRTTLVIAHRLATARQADRILVLEQGRIIGSGTHEELYASNETYRRYLSLQTTEPGIATHSERDDLDMTGTCLTASN
jgi:ABC-type multidrug transport system fused ATPase/permease subunit